ncbi:YhcN/YlaJ family sporulation lipoprotein [Paenibacillus sp. PR3]|uniref:YhcN/YlaJ family sporulation lipoprotein n=1 Tax=Paenibacillus terricola TaxID=2763503 RepID=A0ABR8MPM7_9BACL|nr:YhcN/YlaJ family sporulation lipoprotein [Paenibacillus terricola]MBD3917560.1 YhcN/YlaJ family sporulation lipoprotein [Paenibacillus terricola]
MRKTTGAVLLLSLMMVTTTACGTYNHDRNKNGVTTNRYQSQSVRNYSTDGYRTYNTTDGYRTYNNDANVHRLNSITGMDNYRGTANGTTNRTFTGTNGTTNGTTSFNASSYNRALAEKLSKKAAAVRGVSQATAVVYGNDAIIGIDVKQGMNTRNVEKKVHESVRAEAKGLKVHITGDKNIHTRIRSLQTQLTGTGTGTGLNNGASSVRPYGTTGTYNGLGMNGRYENTNSYGLGNGTFNSTHNGTEGALGLNNRLNNSYQSLGTNGSYNLYGTNGTDGLRHPIRTLGNDIRDIISDIGNAVTAPLR